MNAATSTLSATALLAKLTREQAGHDAASRMLQEERDALLLAKHTGDQSAAARSDEIRAELERRAAAHRELSGLIARLAPQAALEGKQAGLADMRALAGRLLDKANAGLAAVHQVDLAIEALRAACTAAGPLVDAFVRESAGLMVKSGQTLEQQAIDTMLAANMGPMRPLPELIEDRLRALLVLQVDPGSRPNAGTLGRTMQAGCMMLVQRVHDRIAAEEREIASLAQEVEQRPDALPIPVAA